MKFNAVIIAMHVVTIVMAVPVDIGRHVVDAIVRDAVKNCTGKCIIGVDGRNMISHSNGRGQIVEYKGKWKVTGTKDAASRDTSRDFAKTSVGDAIQDENRDADFSKFDTVSVLSDADSSVYGSYYVTLPDGRRQRVDYTADHYGGDVGDAQTAALNATRNTSPRNKAQEAAQDTALDVARTVSRNIARDAVQASAKDAAQNGKQDTERNAEQHIAKDTAHDAARDVK